MGIYAGQAFQVNLGGQLLQVKCPRGAAGGSVIQIPAPVAPVSPSYAPAQIGMVGQQLFSRAVGAQPGMVRMQPPMVAGGGVIGGVAPVYGMNRKQAKHMRKAMKREAKRERKVMKKVAKAERKQAKHMRKAMKKQMKHGMW